VNAWLADKQGYYQGEVHAPGTLETFDDYARHAAQNGQIAINMDASGVARPPDKPPDSIPPPFVDAALLADAQTCKAFLADASPTAAEAFTAEKALIRIVGRLVRELT
jgi:hypothetical protein